LCRDVWPRSRILQYGRHPHGHPGVEVTLPSAGRLSDIGRRSTRKGLDFGVDLHVQLGVAVWNSER